jgi:hypothetical protein
MPRFLIEVPHETETVSCARAAKLLLETGSHFLTHADFGCMDGDHRAWILVEGNTKEEVLKMVPLPYRAGARIVGLTKFSIEDLETLIRQHGG